MKIRVNVLGRLHTKVENRLCKSTYFRGNNDRDRLSRKQCRKMYEKCIAKYDHILNYERVNVQFKHTNVIGLDRGDTNTVLRESGVQYFWDGFIQT